MISKVIESVIFGKQAVCLAPLIAAMPFFINGCEVRDFLSHDVFSLCLRQNPARVRT